MCFYYKVNTAKNNLKKILKTSVKQLPFAKIFVILYKHSQASERTVNAFGSIAQLGEHLPYKQRVTGSSPVVPTIKSAGMAQW